MHCLAAASRPSCRRTSPGITLSHRIHATALWHLLSTPLWPYHHRETGNREAVLQTPTASTQREQRRCFHWPQLRPRLCAPRPSHLVLLYAAVDALTGHKAMSLFEGEAALELPRPPFAAIIEHRFLQRSSLGVSQHAFIREDHLHGHDTFCSRGRYWVLKETNVTLLPQRNLACALRALPILEAQVHVQGERHSCGRRPTISMRLAPPPLRIQPQATVSFW